MNQSQSHVMALVVLALFAFVGCRSSTPSQTAELSTPARTAPNAATSPSPYAIDTTTIPADTKITLSRTICYGTCPAYKLEIFANGRVVYEGEHHVRKKGHAVWQINQDRVKELITEFKKINYFSLSDDYNFLNRRNCPTFGEDAPSVTTSITINGRSKTVSHSHGCQDSEVLSNLEAFEDRIDELADAKRLIG